MTRTATRETLSGLPDGFWSECSAAPHRLLMLDHDGTLASLQQHREGARPSPAVMELLGRIQRLSGTTLAVVSGRPIGEILERVGSLPIALAGEHGWDVRDPEGRMLRHPLPDAAAATLGRAAARAREAGLEGRIETKRTALVLHTRGLSAESADALTRAGRSAWEDLSHEAGFRLDAIDGGLELRSTHRNKGVVVRGAIAAAPAGTLAVYVGDDATDEDAFRVVAAAGFGIRVGPHERPSLARGRLASVAAVEIFLARWLEEQEKGPGG